MSNTDINPLDIQIGGNHYKDCTIQPVEFIEANQLGFLEGCVVKRLARRNRSQPCQTPKKVRELSL